MSNFYDEIEAVKEVYDVQLVNEHIKDGSWRILKIGEITRLSLTGMAMDALVYVIGLRKGKTSSVPTGAPKQESSNQPKQTSSNAPPAPVPTPKMKGPSSKCKYCLRDIWWAKEEGKNVPKNEDGSRHDCR